MTTLAYRFLAGRYHATPWGAHVNEGLVEWPPSPFRVMRALVATGFSRLGWTGIEGAARELFGLLALAPPSYALPEGGTSSHTRHYMPPFKGNTTKVIDAFLCLRTDSILLVHFETALPDACQSLLSRLLNAQPYLGRAEAWVEGSLLSEKPRDRDWIHAASQPPDRSFERVELLACEEPSEYRAWREASVAREVEKKERDERERAKPSRRGCPSTCFLRCCRTRPPFGRKAGASRQARDG
jgi:CRISPR-associated protein Csb2